MRPRRALRRCERRAAASRSGLPSPAPISGCGRWAATPVVAALEHRHRVPGFAGKSAARPRCSWRTQYRTLVTDHSLPSADAAPPRLEQQSVGRLADGCFGGRAGARWPPVGTAPIRPEHNRSSSAPRLMLSQEWSTTSTGPIVCRSPVVTRRSVRALAGPRRAAVDHYLVGRPVWRVRTRRGRRGWTGRRVSRASQDSPLCVRARAQRPLPSVCYVGNDRSRTTVARRLP